MAMYGRNSCVRPVDRPLAWLGKDRLLLDEVNECGVHRRVIASKGQLPNQVEHLLQVYSRVLVEKVHWCMFFDQDEQQCAEDGFGYLWIWWKEGE